MRARLAVDFGTSNTVAVVQRQDEPPRSLLFDGSPILPSAVCLADDGALHVGRDAQQLALMHPTRYEPHPKRRIDDGAVLLGHAEVPVVDLFAGVLRRVAGEARQAGVADPAAPGTTLLTCPADWGTARRATLLAAAQRAGLGQVRLVDEPVAAATYCLAVTDVAVADGQPLVVFDFGGGTFDVALVCREGDGWRMLATGGLDDLGGVDVDAALVGHLGQLLELRDAAGWQRLDHPQTAPEVRDRRTFWTQVGTAKEMLSRVTTAPVPVPRSDATLHLTRDELERVAGPLVARAVDETRRVLQRAEVEPSYLAGVFLVGGSSRLPLVASRLHARFGIAATVPEQPELPVAHGALLIAAASEDAPAAGAAPPASPPRRPPAGANVWRPPLVPGPAFPGAPADVVPPPPPPSTGIRRRVLLTTAVVAVLALVATAGIIAYNGLPGWLPDAVGGAAAGESTTTGNLTELKQVPAPAGTTAVTGVATINAGYYAVAAGGKTQLTAEPTNGGVQWTVDLTMHPERLRLTVVGGLVVVDGERSARHGGANARAVVDAQTRRKLWEARWVDRRDVGYVGTHVIVETEAGGGVSKARIDLRTNKMLWSSTTFSAATLRHQLTTSWPTAQAPPTPVAPGGDSSLPAPGLRQYLRSGTELVEVYDDGDIAVLTSANRKERVRRSGRYDVDPAVWTAYGGVVVVVADVKGQDVLVGHRVSDLRELWRWPAPAGTQVEAVHPCGPKLVCAVSKGSGTAKINAFTIESGAKVWEASAGNDETTGMVVTPAGLLYGSQADAFLHPAGLMPFDGKKKIEYGQSLRLAAADGTRVALVNAQPQGADDIVWVSVGAIDSTTQSTRLAIPRSEGMPETVSLMGDTLVVTTTKSKTVHVLKLTEPRRA